MRQEIIDLYDQFTHSDMDRREFMNKLGKIAGGSSAALALMPLLENNYARAEVVSEKDSRLQADYVEYPGPKGAVRAYQALPTGTDKAPAVIVIHENRGLNPHIEDVARRVAAAGFLAIAPDALSPVGGTPDDTDVARTRLGQLDAEDTTANFVAGVTYGKNHARSTGRVGCVGFCWGGAMANQLAVRTTDMNAAVAFYGRQPATEDVSRIRGAVMLHYGGLDTRINEGIPDYEAALTAAGIKHEIHVYEGANHAFHNDTSPTRYDEAAAKLAWDRTIGFFRENL